MEKFLSYLTPVLLIVVIVLQVISFTGGNLAIGGTTNFDQLDTTDGYSVDGTSIINTNGQFTGTFTGTASTSNSFTLGTGGTAIQKLSASSTTWDPESVANSSSTALTISGYSGLATSTDVCVANHSNVIVSGVWLGCTIASSTAVIVNLFNRSGSAIDVTSGIVRPFIIEF